MGALTWVELRDALASVDWRIAAVFGVVGFLAFWLGWWARG